MLLTGLQRQPRRSGSRGPTPGQCRNPGVADDQRRGEYHAHKYSTAPSNALSQSDTAGDAVVERRDKVSAFDPEHRDKSKVKCRPRFRPKA